MKEKDILLSQLEQAFRKKSWHGPNLLGSIRGLKVEPALKRPGNERHNVWELIVHCAYWKYSVLRRLTSAPKGGFAYRGSNFFERSEPDEALLKADIKLLKKTHLDLIEAVSDLKPKELDRVPKGSTTTFRDLIIGVAAHDLYHAGQIQLIKKM